MSDDSRAEDTNPPDDDDTASPRTGPAIDSSAWTGNSEPPPVSGEELTEPLVYRHTNSGDRRAFLLLIAGWLAVCAGAGGALLFILGESTRVSGFGKPLDQILGLMVLPVIGFLAYVFWRRTTTLWNTGIGTRVLRIDDEGFEDSRLGVGVVPWSAIDCVGTTDAPSWADVVVDLKAPPENTLRDTSGRSIRRLVIWVAPLGIDGHHLARIMDARRRA